MRSLILILPLLLIPFLFYAQKLDYKVMGKGNQIGTMTVEKWQEGGLTHFKSVNESEVSFLKTIKVKHIQQASYKNGRLQNASVTVFVNGNIHNHSLVEYDGDQYIFKEGEAIKDTLEELIHYSSALLYFKEPDSNQQVFSEQFGEFSQISLTEDGWYKLDKKGKDSFYKYKNGKMVHAELGTSIMRTELVLVE